MVYARENASAFTIEKSFRVEILRILFALIFKTSRELAISNLCNLVRRTKLTNSDRVWLEFVEIGKLNKPPYNRLLMLAKDVSEKPVCW